MKRVAAMILCCGVAGMTVQASPELEHNVGQGLGTMIFQGQTGLTQQVLAATTNGLCGNQTFAISSGTLGAKQAQSIVKNETIQIFVAENMDNLARDIAVGSGETLDTLATLLGVPQIESASFNARLRANFDAIYASESVRSTHVVSAIAALRS